MYRRYECYVHIKLKSNTISLSLCLTVTGNTDTAILVVFWLTDRLRMKILILLFTAFVVTSEASLLQCSNMQPLSSGSGAEDFGEVTTIQYCVIDNCTISRIDSGQKLDIIYTTESLIVVIPRGNQTSVAIAKLQIASSCTPPHSTVYTIPTGQYVVLVTLSILMVVVTSYNVINHLVFKALHYPREKLMLLYSLSLMFQFTVFIVMLSMNHMMAVNVQCTCHIMIVTFMVLAINTEALATCILAHLAYLVYRSYKMRRISENKNKSLFRQYMTFVLCIVVSSLGSIIAYDVWTDSGRYTFSSDGYCSYYYHNYSYKTMAIPYGVCGVCKTIQIIIFVIYLVYFYKLKIDCCSDDNSAINRSHNASLIKVAIALGATVGVSYFIWLINSPLAGIGGIALLFVQQCVIIVSFQKMSQLCRRCTSRGM